MFHAFQLLAFVKTFCELPVYIFYPGLLISSFCLYIVVHDLIVQVLTHSKRHYLKFGVFCSKIK